MHTPTRLLAWMGIGILTVLLTACGGSGDGTPSTMTDDPNTDTPTTGTPKSDFSLEDVNPNSATFMTAMTPRQQQSRISAWYFGHAT